MNWERWATGHSGKRATKHSGWKWRAAHKAAVNIGVIVGISVGKTTKGAVNIGDIVGVGRGLL